MADGERTETATKGTHPVQSAVRRSTCDSPTARESEDQQSPNKKTAILLPGDQALNRKMAVPKIAL